MLELQYKEIDYECKSLVKINESIIWEPISYLKENVLHIPLIIILHMHIISKIYK